MPTTTDVTAMRTQIDELDDALVELVQRRREVSAAIQTARLAIGGGRVAPGREAEILDRYAHALGEHGPDLARAVLAVCRGPVTD
ncbi:MAG: chorismate mutase [Actinomycetes bacterium]